MFQIIKTTSAVKRVFVQLLSWNRTAGIKSVFKTKSNASWNTICRSQRNNAELAREEKHQNKRTQLEFIYLSARTFVFKIPGNPPVRPSNDHVSAESVPETFKNQRWSLKSIRSCVERIWADKMQTFGGLNWWKQTLNEPFQNKSWWIKLPLDQIFYNSRILVF